MTMSDGNARFDQPFKEDDRSKAESGALRTALEKNPSEDYRLSGYQREDIQL